jgi:methionyl-tRNA formyltransferase
MAGDRETGMMIMKMDEGLDTGPVALSDLMEIGADETAGELHDRLMQAGAALMVQALGQVEAGTLTLTPQPPEGALYAAKIDKAETRIDWSLPDRALHDRIRGLSPFPGAWCEMPAADGRKERLKLLRSTLAEGGSDRPGEILDDRLTVACGKGALRLIYLQRAGGRPSTADEFLRGTKLEKGTILS